VTRRLALVTGASAGIGAAFAKVYASYGFDLALTARRLDRLEALGAEMTKAHGAQIIPIAADLGEPGAVDTILAAVKAKNRDVDVLVNNAGYGLPGTWLGTKWPDQARALQVMLTAPLELSHKVLPSMVASKWGRIVNVASLAGLTPGAGGGHTTYAAIKSALIKFSQSLNIELEGTGVHCTAVCPGLTWSEFHDLNGTREQLKETPDFIWQTADEVAEIGYRAAEHNRAVAVTGLVNKLTAGLAKVIPDPLAQAISKGAVSRYRNPDSKD